MRQYTISSIPTTYNGVEYLSKLEAQWAVFFDEAGIPFTYEPNGYKLSSGVWYKPDFWLPEQKSFVEIKFGYPTQEECVKADTLSSDTNFPVYIFYGLPLEYTADASSNDSGLMFIAWDDPMFPKSSVGAIAYSNQRFAHCATCRKIQITDTGYLNCDHSGNIGTTPQLIAAAKKSRSFNPRKVYA